MLGPCFGFPTPIKAPIPFLKHVKTSPFLHQRPRPHALQCSVKPSCYTSPRVGVIQLTGKDRLSFLHNQSTNKFEGRQSGQVVETTFTLPTGRVIDLATVLLRDSDALVLVSSNTVNELVERFERYLFPADEVRVSNNSDKFSLSWIFVGEGSANDARVEFEKDRMSYRGTSWVRGHFAIRNEGAQRTSMNIWGSGLSTPGFRILQSPAGSFNSDLDSDFQMLSSAEFDQLRIMDGRPFSNNEFAKKWIVLEAGLWHTVSFQKGCYVGQETIAKLESRDGVNNWLVGLRGDNILKEGAVITDKKDGAKVGVVTSSTTDKNGHGISLGYVKRKRGVAKPGTVLSVDGADVLVQDLPFATRTKEACADGEVRN